MKRSNFLFPFTYADSEHRIRLPWSNSTVVFKFPKQLSLFRNILCILYLFYINFFIFRMSSEMYKSNSSLDLDHEIDMMVSWRSICVSFCLSLSLFHSLYLYLSALLLSHWSRGNIQDFHGARLGLPVRISHTFFFNHVN